MTKPRGWIVVLALVCGITSACTTSLTHELVPNEAQKRPGFPYYLPKQSFTVSITYELTGCPDINSADAAIRSEELSIEQTATIVETPIPDEAEYYLLTYGDLDSAMKTSSFNATVYPNKTIHTVGAQVEDRTAAIIKSTVGTAIAVAKMAMGVPTAAKPPSLCKPNVYDAIKGVRAAKAKLADPTLDDKTRAGVNAALTSARASLQIQKQIDFVPDWKTQQTKVILLVPDLNKWFADYKTYLALNSDAPKAFEANTSTEIHIFPKRTVPPPPPKTTNATAGMIFRDPAPSSVEVCSGPCGNVEPIAKLVTSIAQLGRYMLIELENGPFDKNNLSLSFAANGSLESMTYATESSLEKATGALADTATQVSTFVDKKQAADKAKQEAEAGAELKATKAKTDLLNAKADQIQAQQRLTNLGGQ